MLTYLSDFIKMKKKKKLILVLTKLIWIMKNQTNKYF